jgi:4-hydroxythreonine-4-phosphate dehydrogenase
LVHRVVGSRTIGITLGDPSGIGPEIVAAALVTAEPALRARLRLYCDRPIVERALAGAAIPDRIEIVCRGALAPDDAPPGRPTRAGGVAQVAYLEAAVADALTGDLGALVTAPIAKEQARAAGFDFPGHTEFLAERLGAQRVAMMFVGPRLRVVLATVHLPLAQVPAALTAEGIAGAGALAAETLARDLGITRPRIGVVGLNPHAGEGGLFGREEIEIIAPAVELLRQRSPQATVTGPLVPDAAFRAATDGAHDLLVAMYHDQALIPVKLVDFEHAVNVTAGLPIVRTSPDHGVAYDIAGTGRARADSFAAALDLAAGMLARRNA